MRVGRHDIGFEEPDLLRIEIVDAIDLDEAIAGAKIVQTFAVGKPKVYCISDIRRANAVMPSDARKAFIEGMKTISIVAVVSIGGTFRDRVIMKIMTTALKLLARRSLELGAAESEQEARDWLAERGCVACSTPGASR